MMHLAMPRIRPMTWDLANHPAHLAVAGMFLRWIHSGSRWRARIFYTLVIWQLVGMFLVVLAIPALGDPGGAGAGSTGAGGETGSSAGTHADPSALGWMTSYGVKDSSGIPISDYFIAVDKGNAINLLSGGDKKNNLALAPILEIEYGIFKITNQVALWILGYGLSFKWLDFIASPFLKLGEAMENFTHSIGLISLALVIAAGIAALAIVRGHISKAAYQVVSALVAVALMTTVFAHPVGMLLGSDGYLAKARDVGISVADGLTSSTGGSAAGDQPQITKLQAALADSFVRKPTQILNFNQVADNAGCKSVWEAGIRGKNPDKLKDAIAKCGGNGKDMKYAADHLTGDRLATAALLTLLSLMLLAFGCYLVGKIVLSVILALTNAVILVVVGLGGTMVGPLQASAFKCAVNLGMAVLMIPVTVAYAGAYSSLLSNMLNVDGNPVQILILATVLLVLSVIAFRRITSGLKSGRSSALNFLNRHNTSPAPAQTPNRALQTLKLAALTTAGAAVGVPPSVSGLAYKAGRSLKASFQKPKVASGDQKVSTDSVKQYQENYKQYLENYAGAMELHNQAAAANQPAVQHQTASAPAQPPSNRPRVAVQAPPLHPVIAEAIGARPQRPSAVASMPPIVHRPGAIAPHRQRPSATAARRPQPARPAQSRPAASTPVFASTSS